MEELDPEDMLVEAMLKNYLSGKKPPDVSNRVLDRVFPTPGQRISKFVRSPYVLAAAALLALCAGIAIWMGNSGAPPTIVKTPSVKETNPQPPPQEVAPPQVAKIQTIFEDPPLNGLPPAAAQDKDYRVMAGVITKTDGRRIFVRSDLSGQEFEFGVSKVDTDPKEIASLFKRIALNKHVVVRWRFDDPPLFNSVVFLEKKPLTDAAPESGIAEGTVAAIGSQWIELKNDQGVHRYTPVWIGDAPDAGGHFDRDTLRKMHTLKIGDLVRIKWYLDLHRRAVSVEPRTRAEKHIEF